MGQSHSTNINLFVLNRPDLGTIVFPKIASICQKCIQDNNHFRGLKKLSHSEK